MYSHQYFFKRDVHAVSRMTHIHIYIYICILIFSKETFTLSRDTCKRGSYIRERFFYKKFKRYIPLCIYSQKRPTSSQKRPTSSQKRPSSSQHTFVSKAHTRGRDTSTKSIKSIKRIPFIRNSCRSIPLTLETLIEVFLFRLY